MFAVIAALFAGMGVAAAQDASEQNRLFQQMVRNPTNHDITYEYARVATERGDYEAAIGALERLLFYNPHLTRVKYELGALYFRLRSYEMAKRYFREALASPDLDPVARQRIEAYLPDADKQTQASRLSGFVQAGVRSQSNATFAPTGDFIRLGGQNLALLPSATKKSDTNAFGLIGLSHDYDLGNQRGDILETRFSGYLTAQTRFDDLNVGLFDASFGPRLALAPELLPGATVKPYVVGGNVWVGGQSYLSSVGAGVSFALPVNDRFSFGPDFEYRRADVSSGALATVSGFGSSDWYSAGLSGVWQINQRVRLDSRGLYRRGNADIAFQSFDQYALETALTVEFAPPFAGISRNWSIAPFVKYIDTRFDLANPFIDPFTVRHDGQWSFGGILNMPMTRALGVSATVQYDRINSNIPNYKLDNLSVMVGPTARF